MTGIREVRPVREFTDTERLDWLTVGNGQHYKAVFVDLHNVGSWALVDINGNWFIGVSVRDVIDLVMRG